MIDEEKVEAPIWILVKIRETLRMTNNLCIEKHYTGCYARMVREAQIMIEKIIKNEEITGGEYIQAMNEVAEREGN